MKRRITQKDYVKANRKGSREAEIENHGRSISYNRVFQSKKVYDRKKIKAGFKKRPASFFILTRLLIIGR